MSSRGGMRDPIVLYLGGLERNRGSRLMVEAFQRVLHICPDARLHVVGHFMPPDLERELREDVQRAGFEASVMVTGQVPFESIGAYLERAAVGWIR